MIRGWCPTVHAPMPSGDGLLVRVKPFGGRLPAASLRALAAAVAENGNGVVELTGRGNLQMRGVRNAPAFARAMVAAGLADPDPAREARRNVVTVPPCDDAVVVEAEELLASTPGLAPKFCVVVWGDRVFLDGEAVVSLRQALPSTAVPSPNHVYPQRAGNPLPLAGEGDMPDATALPTGRGRFILPLPLGEGRGEGVGHLLHPPFGATNAAALARLADHVPEVRTTPWRALLSPLPAPGFAAAPASIAACPGAPACGSASVPARADAARLMAAGFAGLHVSGCAKGCAYPRAATTLVGRDGRYDLVRNGRASDAPEHRALTLEQAMALL